MKQFKTILSFELKNYFKNKTYIVVSILMILAILIGLSLPRIKESFSSEKETEQPTLFVVASEELVNKMQAALPDYELERLEISRDEAINKVKGGDYDHIFYSDGSKYDYIVQNYTMQDYLPNELQKVIDYMERAKSVESLDLSQEQKSDILFPKAMLNMEIVGKNQGNNFLYTYVYVIIIYMIIMLYGSIVAMNVATEKSSRAMEMLITSADTKAFITAKVFAATIAATFQLFLMLACSIIAYKLNESYYIDNYMVQSLFAIPLDLALYALLYFVLGFIMFSAMYASLGSTVSKVEEVNQAVGPFTMIFVAGYFVVMYGIGSGNVDSVLMKFVSIFPLTSPIAMFARISMGNVQTIELISSIILLLVCSMLMLKLDAKIYRMGVLMYGTPPKLKNIIKALRQK